MRALRVEAERAHVSAVDHVVGLRHHRSVQICLAFARKNGVEHSEHDLFASIFGLDQFRDRNRRVRQSLMDVVVIIFAGFASREGR